MSSRTWFLLIVILLLLLLLKPSTVWKEYRRVWAQRDRFLRVAVIVVGLYFLYGLYRLYAQGYFPWW